MSEEQQQEQRQPQRESRVSLDSRSRLDRLERLNRAIAQLNRDYDNDLISQRETLERIESDRRTAESERDVRLHNERLQDLRSREAHIYRLRRESMQRLGQYTRIQRDLGDLMRRLGQHQESLRELTAQERTLRSRLNESAENSRSERSDHFDDDTRSFLLNRALNRSFINNMSGDAETNENETFTRTRRPASMLFENGRFPSSHKDHEAATRLLEDTIAYLANLRNATSLDDCRMFAALAGFDKKDVDTKAFVYNLGSIRTPAFTTLLSPGATFSGEQFASHAISSSSNNNYSSFTSSSLSGYSGLRFSRLGFASDGEAATASATTPASETHNRSSCDKWPVTVRIYGVDWERMTLSASMEAYDVPSHPSTQAGCNPASHSLKSITTYLEGEIVDFCVHSLLTENFNSSLDRDAIYWRKLPPFNEVPFPELPAKLLNQEFLDECNKNYILMRWKEKCFVHNSTDVSKDGLQQHADYVVESDGCGLTISGFYYISMRRSDGLVEGLYCDPHSSPYQYLRLKRKAGTSFQGWTFR